MDGVALPGAFIVTADANGHRWRVADVLPITAGIIGDELIFDELELYWQWQI
jgi:hypothetical protein